MKAIALTAIRAFWLGALAGAILAASTAGGAEGNDFKWLYYSDGSAEYTQRLDAGEAALAIYRLPGCYTTVSRGRFYSGGVGSGNVKYVLYDVYRRLLWRNADTYKSGWNVSPYIGATFAPRTRVYIGVEAVIDGLGVGADLDEPHYSAYMWVRSPRGEWDHPSYNGGELNFLIDLQVITTDTVEAASWGRVKALYRD